jgi:hypothetical protein
MVGGLNEGVDVCIWSLVAGSHAPSSAFMNWAMSGPPVHEPTYGYGKGHAHFVKWTRINIQAVPGRTVPGYSRQQGDKPGNQESKPPVPATERTRIRQEEEFLTLCE